MLILAAVRGKLTARLHQAAGRRFEFEAASTWDRALQAILRRPVEIAVLDPALEGEPTHHEIERLGMLFPSLPTVLYTSLTPTVAPVLLRLGGSGVQQVVIAGHDDHPKRLSEVLVNESSRAVTAQLIGSLADMLAGCPSELRWAIETMVREPASVQSVQQLAERARMDRRTCLRWFARSLLPPPKVTLMVVRAVHAHRLLQDPGYTVDDVAAKLSYSQTKTLTLAMKEVFGMTPGELRVRLTPDEALALVRARYFPPAVPLEDVS